MELQVKAGAFSKAKAECLVVGIFADKSLTVAAKTVDKLCAGAITNLIALKDIAFKAGAVAWLPAPQGAAFARILVTCLNTSKQQISASDIRTCAASVVTQLNSRSIKQAVWAVESHASLNDKQAATIIAETTIKAQYRYTHTKTQNIKPPSLKKLALQGEKSLSAGWKKGLAAGTALGKGINVARELGNLPGNICTPTYLARAAKDLAKSTPALSTKIIDEPALKKLGMGSFLSVSAGSDEPAKLIIMEYKGAKESVAPTVLVGKGITFDTGGISLKGGAGMDEMKFDMCGAASVFGAMQALTLLKPAINVIGVVAAAENMPNGNATKPGDVVTSMSGQTIEVLNTDAEGRLVLCDALTYVERFKPKAVVDIATLTGACVVALGAHASGLYANDQNLADELKQAGEQACDKAWQMPLWDEYQKSLDSNFADMANIGGREAGSVTAACFLSRYAKAYKWAHLDVAGTAWKSGAAKGATGRPVGLLMQYLTKAYN